MNVRRIFDIDIIKLSNKKHNFDYHLDSGFFAEFENSLIQKGDLEAMVELNKSETMIQATFDIKGKVELICDRSLENFDFPVNISESLIFKYGENFAELSDEIISIPRDTQKLNVSQYIYEFIGLAVPIKKLHPRFVEDEVENEDGTLIYSTQKEEGEEKEESEVTDPRWEILKNLKNNNN